MWDEAELTTCDGEEASTLERRLPSDAWLVPDDISIDRDGDRLVWSASGGHRIVRDGPGVLNDFVKLGTAPPERILRYAKRWGILMICEHGLPISHNLGPSGLTFDQGVQGLGCWPLKEPYDPNGPLTWEPLAVWRSLARQAEAILDVAAKLHIDQRPTDQEWDATRGIDVRDPNAWYNEVVGGTAGTLASTIQDWLIVGNVRPTVSFKAAAGWSIALGGHLGGASRGAYGQPTFGTWGLFPAIALQLAFSVARAEGLSICSACGHAYTRRRRPKTGQRNYCPTCKENGAPWRLAQQTRRAKLRG